MIPLLLAAALAAPTHLPTPFTAAQIRRAMPVGSEITLRVEGPETIGMRWTVLRADADDMTMRVQIDHDGTWSEGSEREHTWVSLRDHAAFSVQVAKRERVRVTCAFGTFPGWRYVVNEVDGEGSPQVVTMDFVTALPGPPVRAETVRADGVKIVMTQVGREPRGGR